MTKTVSRSKATRYKTWATDGVVEGNDDEMDELALLDGVAFIPLRDAKTGVLRAYVLIDAEDAEQIRPYRWSLTGEGYAYHGIGRIKLRIHRLVAGARDGDGLHVDHRDRDTLNCRRDNLLKLTPSQHLQNQGNRSGSLSQYRGVAWDKHSRKWKVTVRVQGVVHNVGMFTDEHEAGAAAKAKRLEIMPFAVD